jgi:hypothetical protein
MAHHQGMSLLSLAYVLLARPMQKRFESDPLLQATLLLLQERIPRAALFHPHATELSDLHAGGAGPALPVRVLTSPDTTIPEVQLLSNGRYHVMVTNAGGGSSRWKDLALTRWREDGISTTGYVLLPPRRGQQRVLVDRLSADTQEGRKLRGDLFGRPGRVSPQGFRLGDAH